MREISIQAHLAYSVVLAAIADPVSSTLVGYNIPSKDQEWAYLQANHVLSSWDKVFASSEYKAATWLDRLVLLRAPFAILERLEDYRLGYTTVTARGINYVYTCSSDLPTMRRGFYSRKLYMVNNRRGPSPLEHTLSKLLLDKAMTPNYAASVLAEKSMKLKSEIQELLALEDGVLLVLAHKDRTPGRCASQGGQLRGEEPVDDVGLKFRESAEPLLQVLDLVASNAIAWCSSPLPFCFSPYEHKLQRTYIETINNIAKEAGYPLTSELEKAEQAFAQTRVAEIY